MDYKKPRKVDTTKMTHIKDAVLDNHIPCLCNGKTDVINECWNPKGWNAEFHIPDEDYHDDVAVALRNEITSNTMAFVYLIHESEIVVAKGEVVYDIVSGQIHRFVSDSEREEIRLFIENLIHYFGEMNYIAKLNAMNKPKKNGRFSNMHKSRTNKTVRQKTVVEYAYTESREQPSYVPKMSHNTSKVNRAKSPKTTLKHSNVQQPAKHIVRKIVYKVEYWERAGYYRHNGTYVRPCSCKRNAS